MKKRTEPEDPVAAEPVDDLKAEQDAAFVLAEAEKHPVLIAESYSVARRLKEVVGILEDRNSNRHNEDLQLFQEARGLIGRLRSLPGDTAPVSEIDNLRRMA